MVANCAPDYQNQSVVANCEKGTHPLRENDVDLIVPVTNIEKRVTYVNKYCAECNHDKNVESWNFLAGCGESADDGQAVTSGPSYTYPTSTTKSRPVYTRPEQDIGRKFESNTPKVNAIPNTNDYVGGCRSETSPCRSEPKPHPIPQVPTYEYPKAVPIYPSSVAPQYFWSGNSSNGGLNIRIEIGGRFKRQQPSSGKKRLNYAKYASQINELIKTAKFDESSQQFVSTSKEGNRLVCRFNSTYPKKMEDAVRTCVPNVVSTCGEGGSSCPSYTSIVYEKTTKTPYRNRECASCNGVQESRLTGCIEKSRAGASTDLTVANKQTSQDNKNLKDLSESKDVELKR